MANSSDDRLTLLQDLIAKAKAAGADAADAMLYNSASLSVTQRLGKSERLERSEEGDLGLRVFVGQRMAIASSSDRSPKALAEVVERAVAMARLVPEDPYCGLADPDQLARDWPDLDMFDPAEPSAESLIALASATEDAAMAVKGVTNSEGGDASWTRADVAVAASNGFTGAYSLSGNSLSASVIAGEGTAMETDYDFTSATHAEDMEDAATIGTRAGERAVARLGARKIESTKVPILFDPRVSGGMLRHLIGAISGPSIARGTSFLKESLGQQIFAKGIMVTDDPHIKRGRRSKPFDAEGLANSCRNFIEDGVLTSWLMDLRSARQLGLQSTGHGSRGTSGPPSPSPSNLYMAAGKISREDMIAEVDRGFYVTQMMGSAVNQITGDYSRGASGFWIEKGEIAFPVNEITVAGNLKDMFKALVPASDLQFRYGIDCPTLRVDGMTIAGK